MRNRRISLNSLQQPEMTDWMIEPEILYDLEVTEMSICRVQSSVVVVIEIKRVNISAMLLRFVQEIMGIGLGTINSTIGNEME